MTLANLAEQLGKHMLARSFKLTTAESCTGGGLSYWITSIPGSSDWFDRGFVTYSNAAKVDMLEVPQSILTTHGAVSEQTARAMAEGALTHSLATHSISITGIAGPDGGSIGKPVGMVCFGFGRKGDTTLVETQFFHGNRLSVREQSILFAMERLYRLVG